MLLCLSYLQVPLVLKASTKVHFLPLVSILHSSLETTARVRCAAARARNCGQTRSGHITQYAPRAGHGQLVRMNWAPALKGKGGGRTVVAFGEAIEQARGTW
jgi:hypothetical protein